jgi:hypothetical protein
MKEPVTTAELREMSASASISFSNTSPYAISEVMIERIGFADIPVCWLRVNCREADIGPMVPVVRQKLYRWLEANGVPNTALKFSPRVGEMRQRERFVDANPSSKSCGERKLAGSFRFMFEINASDLGFFEFGKRGYSWRLGRIREQAE